MDATPLFETPRERWLRRLSVSLPLGHVAGIEIRLLVLALVIVPVLAALTLTDVGVRAAEAWSFAAIFTVELYLVVLAHELGHSLVALRYSIPVPRISLSPLGGLAHLGLPPSSPRVDILVSLGGPATHLAWLAVFYPLSRFVDPELLRPRTFDTGLVAYAVTTLVWLNLSLLLFNLLPFFPMDGGRVLRVILARRLSPGRASLWTARIGMGGAVLIAVAAFWVGGYWVGILLAVAISNFLMCRQEMRAARYRAGPWEGPTRQPWETDPDAWKRGGPSVAVRPARAEPSRAEGRDDRTERKERRRQEEARRLEEDLDRVLARVSEVGLENLTRAERRILDRASKAKRHEE